MNIFLKSIVAGGIIAAASFFVSEKKSAPLLKKYAIDYTVKAAHDTSVRASFSLSKIIMILETRFKQADYQCEIKKIDSSKIHVSILHASDTAFPNSIITYNDKVQFTELFNLSEVEEVIRIATEIINKKNTVNKGVAAYSETDTMSKKISALIDNLEMNTTNHEQNKLIEFSQPFTDQNSSIVYPAEIGKVWTADTATVRQFFNNTAIKIASPQPRTLCFGKPEKHRSGKKELETVSFYFLKTLSLNEKAKLENEDIKDASLSFAQDGYPEVVMEFNNLGAQKWAFMTRENVGNFIGITVGGTVISAPKVLSVIENGRSSISGFFTMQESKLLSMALKSSRLPAKLTIASKTIKEEKQNSFSNQRMLVILLIFIGFSVIAFFVFKALEDA